MKDGLYDDGLVRTHRAAEPSDFKIGKAAQTQAFHDLKNQAEQTSDAHVKSDSAAKLADAAFVQLGRIFDDKLPSFKTIVGDYEKSVLERKELEQRIAALDGAGDGGLKQKRQAQLDLKRHRAGQRTPQEEAHRKHTRAADIAMHTIESGESTLGSKLSVMVTWSSYGQYRKLYDRISGRASYRSRFDGLTQKGSLDRHRMIASEALKAVSVADDDRIKIERRVRQTLGDYFERFGVVSHVGTESEPLQEVKPWMVTLIQEMEENELRRYERQAAEAAGKAKTLLRGELSMP